MDPKKNKKSEKCLAIIFKIIMVIVAIGFVASIAVLIHERYLFSRWIISATNYTDSIKLFDNLARLLEAYNKSNTTEILSLLYTVLATLAFSYGVVVFNNLQKEARDTKKNLEEIIDKEHTIRNQAFFSLFEHKLNLILYFVVNLKAFPQEGGTWLTRLYEQIGACDRHFPIWKIMDRRDIDPFSKNGLIDTLTMITQILTHMSQENFEVPALTPDGVGNGGETVIQMSLRICNGYLRAIVSLKVNEQLSD